MEYAALALLLISIFLAMDLYHCKEALHKSNNLVSLLKQNLQERDAEIHTLEMECDARKKIIDDISGICVDERVDDDDKLKILLAEEDTNQCRICKCTDIDDNTAGYFWVEEDLCIDCAAIGTNSELIKAAM